MIANGTALQTQTIDYPSTLIYRKFDSPITKKINVKSGVLHREPRYVASKTMSDLIRDDPSFRDLVGQLVALRENDEDGEEGACATAIGLALSFLPLPWTELGSDWTDPFLSTDGYGGVRMTWHDDKREVRAVIPADENRARYIYFEENSRYGTVPNFTAFTLASYLSQLHREGVFAEGRSR